MWYFGSFFCDPLTSNNIPYKVMSFAFDCPILFKTNRIGGAMVSLVDSTSVYDFSIGFWNYSDSVIFLGKYETVNTKSTPYK
jgi:hypothetical protein